MFLLDTNVVSELRRDSKAHPAVRSWAAGLNAKEQFLSAISIVEIARGICEVRGKDIVRATLLQDWLDSIVLPHFAGRILNVDSDIAQRCAPLHVPRRRDEFDALIAATALAHNLTLVTRNTKDFADTGVRVFNPWG